MTVKRVIDIAGVMLDFTGNMFVKVFDQILDSSIAENYELRHFFEDMLKLADKGGAVDMTPEAISRRINLPLEKVVLFLGMLQETDAKSRSRGHDGRRLIPLDSHRDWGWLIVNYEHYRNIRNQEERRAYNRDAQRKFRENKKKGVTSLRQKVIAAVKNDPNTKADKSAMRKLTENGHTTTRATREYDLDESVGEEEMAAVEADIAAADQAQAG